MLISALFLVPTLIKTLQKWRKTQKICQLLHKIAPNKCKWLEALKNFQLFAFNSAKRIRIDKEINPGRFGVGICSNLLTNFANVWYAPKYTVHQSQGPAFDLKRLDGLNVAIWNTLQVVLDPNFQNKDCNSYNVNILQTYYFPTVKL